METTKKNPIKIACAIFICKSCHLACVALPSTWIVLHRTLKMKAQENDSKPIIDNTHHYNANPYIVNKNFLLNFNGEWNFQDVYEKITKEVSNKFYFDLPLCDCCMKKALSMGFCQFSLTQALDIYLSEISIPGNTNLFVEDILYNIQRMHVENRDFKHASKIAIDQKVATYSPKKNRKPENQDDEKTTKANSNAYRLPRFRNSSSFKSCTLHTVFSFSFCRQYATINGFRLGSLTPDTVSRPEVDTGLFFLSQFVIYLGKMVGVNITDIRTSRYMEVQSEQGTFEEVHFPSPKSKQKKYDWFNICMARFFQICYEIFSKPCINESQRRPPFQIDVSEKKIGDLPYKFSKKDPSRWTHVMRLLVINFKTIQFLALENFVNSIE